MAQVPLSPCTLSYAKLSTGTSDCGATPVPQRGLPEVILIPAATELDLQNAQASKTKAGTHPTALDHLSNEVIAASTTHLITDLMAIPEPYAPSLGLMLLDEVDPVEDTPPSEIMTSGWEPTSSEAGSSSSSIASSPLPVDMSKICSTSETPHGVCKGPTGVAAQRKTKMRKLLMKRRVRVANPGLSGPLPAITQGLPFSGGPSDTRPPILLDISGIEAFDTFVRNTLAPTVTNIMICKMIGSPNAFASNQRAAHVPFGLDETRDPVADTPSQRLYTEAFYAAKFRLSRLILNHEAMIPSKPGSYEGGLFYLRIFTGQVSSTLQDKVRHCHNCCYVLWLQTD